MIHSYQSTNIFAERYLISVKGGKQRKEMRLNTFQFPKIFSAKQTKMLLANEKKNLIFASVKT